MRSRFVPIDPAAGAASERADAARNRRKVLDAAERLFAEHGVECVSMDDIAEAAGVGKGTLYRRFGDRSGLAIAVLDAHERAFQEALLRGAPPLGPGAGPGERLTAFFHAMCAHLEQNSDLLAAVGPGRYRTRVYGVYHLHVAILLGEARPDCDGPVLADLILGAVSPDLYRHLRHDRRLDPDQIAAALDDVVLSVLGGPSTVDA